MIGTARPLAGLPHSRRRDLSFTTWDSEGSRARRTIMRGMRVGTTTGVVVPVRSGMPQPRSDSGAETAFPVLHGTANARAAQRRPGAKHAS